MKLCRFILLLMTLGAAAAHAEVDSALANEIENRLGGAQTALAATPGLVDEAQDQAWLFQWFWLRVRARIGWSLPGLVNLQLIPEFEMMWGRNLPSGWVTYRPPVAMSGNERRETNR